MEPKLPAIASMQSTTNPADVVWMLISTALVLLMTPALGFFYGGLVRRKNVLNTMMMSLASMGVIGLTWAVIGYTLAFGGAGRTGGWVGSLRYFMLGDVGLDAGTWGAFPHLLFFSYQGAFAIIAAALVSGAIVERMHFGAYITFIVAWSLLVYSPVAHWVWGGGWLGQLGALDFAGGAVIHVNAGAAAIACALAVGNRADYGRQAFLPHNVPYVILGAALLWFGWFGFNGGSALGANDAAVLAFTNTLLAPAAALVMWLVLDMARTGKHTAVGAATGAVVGLVAITPAAGFVSPRSALVIGAIAAAPSYFAIQWRPRTRLDDSLDVFAAHGVGGITGALLTGVFAQKAWGAPADGAIAGVSKTLVAEVAAVVSIFVYSFVCTFALLKIISFVAPLRRTAREEAMGMDITQHGEDAYNRGEGALLVVDRRSAERSRTT